ncbi:MAG: hypothetical protein NTW65_10910 [Deltaproteobacteria bacterium]|nr:hypothetical protein [Deltaproteobacteria bacterium]
MKRLEFLLVPIIILGILVLFGCEQKTGSPFVMKDQPAEQSSGGSTSAPTLGQSFQQSVTIPADKALIYIYRTPAQTGFAAFSSNDAPVPFGVKANGKTLITLVSGGYYTYLAEPGQIEFTTFEVGFMAPSSVFSLTVDAKVQQAYYLKGAHGKGLGGRANLRLVSPEAGASEIANCKLITQ